MKYNWTPVIETLFNALTAAQFALIGVDDGGDTIKGDAAALNAAICSVHESWLYVRDSFGRMATLFIVLGNSPSETVSDFTYTEELDAAITRFSDSWLEHDECPMIADHENNFDKASNPDGI